MKVGWIGVGNMGNPMASHMLASASEFWVHDLRREAAANLLEAGARWAESPAEVTSKSDFIFMSLPMPHHVEAVSTGPDGVMEAVDPSKIVVDLSTNSAETIARVHQKFRDDKGVTFLDAPVSGGVKGAISRDLCVMVGGDEGAFNAVRPLLDAIGDKVMYCGPSGTGTVCKLTNQIVGLMIGSAVAEALTMGVKAGVQLKTLATAIAQSTGGKNRPLDAWADGTFEQSFEGDAKAFFLELGLKDARLACELGAQAGVPMDIANLCRQRLVEADARGWGRKMMGVYRLLQEERAGIDLAASYKE